MVLFVMLAAVATNAPPEPDIVVVARGIVVKRAEFFSDRTDAVGVVRSRATTTIPYRPATSCYRWVLHVAPRQREARIQERLVMPSAAGRWGGIDGVVDSPTAVHADRAGATTELTDSLEDGMLSSSWCIEEGDPEGAHSIFVSEGSRLLHRFDFTVGGDPQAPATSR